MRIGAGLFIRNRSDACIGTLVLFRRVTVRWRAGPFAIMFWFWHCQFSLLYGNAETDWGRAWLGFGCVGVCVMSDRDIWEGE